MQKQTSFQGRSNPFEAELPQPSRVDEARHWSRLLGPPTLATAATSLVTLAATALLFRQLPEEAAGTLALLFAVLEIMTLIGILGQSTVITRRYSLQNEHGFDWQRDLMTIVALSIPIGLVGSVIAGLLLPLTLPSLAYLFFSSVLFVSILALVWMLNSHGHYVWSSILLRIPNALLIIPALLITLLPRFSQLELVIGLHFVGFLAVLLTSYWLALRHIRRGSARISSSERKQGLVFLVNQASLLLSYQGIFALGGALVSPARLASYAAMALLLRVFKLLTSIQSMVVTPELIRAERPNYRRLIAGAAAIAIIAGVLTVAFAPMLADWAYSGKYDEGLVLIPWLALAGMLMILEIIPRSHLIGRTRWPTVRRFVLSEGTFMLGVFVIGVVIVARLDILGIAIATTLALAIRNLFSYSFFFWSLSAETESTPQVDLASE